MTNFLKNFLDETFFEKKSKKITVHDQYATIRWMKESLIETQEDGSRFTKTLPKKQVLFFLNIPVADHVLLQDCYKYSHELFLYTPGFGKIDNPGPNILITIQKEGLKPIIMKPNSTIELEKDRLRPDDPLIYLAYYKGIYSC